MSIPFFVDRHIIGNDNRFMHARKSLTSTILITLIVGISGLVNMSHNTHFSAIRGVDALQLIGSGMCFGVALFAFVQLMRAQRNG